MQHQKIILFALSSLKALIGETTFVITLDIEGRSMNCSSLTHAGEFCRKKFFDYLSRINRHVVV